MSSSHKNFKKLRDDVNATIAAKTLSQIRTAYLPNPQTASMASVLPVIPMIEISLIFCRQNYLSQEGPSWQQQRHDNFFGSWTTDTILIF